MEKLFNSIQKDIALGLPWLTLVDEDYGQLDTAEDTYPVTFPCVLINFVNVEWETITDNYQRGTANITIKLCIDCFDDTHYSSGVSEKVEDRLKKYKALHAIAKGVTVDNVTELERLSSRFYTLPGNIKVYESNYECIIDEDEG